MPSLSGGLARAGALLCAVATLAGAVAAEPVDVLTFHGDDSRLGWNSRETVLKPGNVTAASFGKVWETKLDSSCYASPLAASNVKIGGRLHDVVYAATENNSVYALDAATGLILWQTEQLARPLTVDEFNSCPNVNPTVGITGTPVIDRKTGAIYVCGATQPRLRQVYKVWALDIETGKVKSGWPVTVGGTWRNVEFDGGQLVQRAALSLIDGWVYISFGARCDVGNWHGWTVGIDAARPAAKQRLFSYSATGDGGGIWCSGGLAADTRGNLYTATGNGEFALGDGRQNLSEAVVRLTTAKGLAFSGSAKDFYVPVNYKFLDDNDEDLGGSGAIVLPDMPETNTPHLVLTAGKDGLVYLLNRDNLGGVGGELQKTRYFGDPNGAYHGNIRSMPAYFDGGGEAGRFVYVPGNETGPNGEKGMVALKIAPASANGPAALAEAWTLKTTLDNAATPAVSSDGAKDGIVWLISPRGDDDFGGGAGKLWAFNALTGDVLYDSGMAGQRDTLFDPRKFTAPVITGGRVFVASSRFAAYGLLEKADMPAASAGEVKK
jgi:outer membrane protein assembly factor BamB